MKSLKDNIGQIILSIITCILTTTAVPGTSIKSHMTTEKNKTGYIPKDGFVPNIATSIKIAEAIWLPIYGERIYKKKPYNVKLKNGVRIIEGTLHQILKVVYHILKFRKQMEKF